MLPALLARKIVLIAVGAVMVLVGVMAYWRNREPAHDPIGPNPNAAAGPQTDFRECARESGITFRMAFLPNEQGEKFKINLYDHGCGVAIGDFDGDGRDDIYFLNQLGPNALYRNKGDGAFEDVTNTAGVGVGDRVCVGATFADYDNDGRQDLYVTSTRGGNILFRNLGNGTFKDVTKDAGLNCVAHSQTAAFFDFDNDGQLDLLVTNTAKWTLNDYVESAHYFPGAADLWELAGSPIEHNILYRNNGNGTFTDVTAKAGLAGNGWGGDVAVFDYDDDGYLDLLVTNMFGASHLYRNNRNGTFTEVTREVLGRISWGAIGSKAFDFNNDGRLDLLIVDMHSDMWLPPSTSPQAMPPGDLKKKHAKIMGPLIAKYEWAAQFENRFVATFKIRYDDVLLGNSLFQSQPSGKFKEVSDQANLETFWPWGIATGDFDNDGFEDVFLPSGMGYPYEYWPNSLMMNNRNGAFTDRAAATGIEQPRPGGANQEEKIGGQFAARSSRCAAAADFTNSGRVDLVVNNFNDRPYLFRNHFPKKNYVAFRLRGTSWAEKGEHKKSSRDAIGALVRIYLGKEVMVRQVQAAGGYLSQSSKSLHFGLGDRSRIDRVEIRWPSGRVQTIPTPAINSLHDVTEPEQQ